MPVFLLDLNVLLALAWQGHTHHLRAREWFQKTRMGAWHTCALTQSGFLRLSCNPMVVRAVLSAARARQILLSLTAHADHRYLDDLPSPLLPEFDGIWTRVQGHQQISDAYLVCVARHHQVKLATLDETLKNVCPWKDQVNVI